MQRGHDRVVVLYEGSVYSATIRAMKQSIFRMARMLGLHTLSRFFRRRRLTILLYHGVTPSAGGLFNYRRKFISPEMFERQIAYLTREYTILPLDQAVSALYSGTLGKNTLVITFDDGYRNVYEHA